MKRFRTAATILVLFAVLGGMWAVSIAGEDAPRPPDQLDLAAEVARLRDRVAELEKRLADLEQRQPAVLALPQETAPQLAPSIVPYFPRGQTKRPRVWGEGEINGMRFYIVPLQEGANEPPAPPAAIAPTE